jgi:hypothetical protein
LPRIEKKRVVATITIAIRDEQEKELLLKMNKKRTTTTM